MTTEIDDKDKNNKLQNDNEADKMGTAPVGKLLASMSGQRFCL